MSDIVELLNAIASPLALNASDEIISLRAHVAELEEALEDMIEDAERQMKNPSHHMPFSMNKARAVLAKRRET